MDKPNLFIAIPCYDTMQCETVEALLRIDRELPFPHTIRFCKGNSLVSSARNTLAAHFLAGTWTHLLFIDADIVFTPAQIVRLLSHNEAIVGGLYAKRHLHYGEQGIETMFCADEIIGHDPVRDLQEVRCVGTGFLSIRRDVFETMVAALGPSIEYVTAACDSREDHRKWIFFPVGMHLDEDGIQTYLSEDFYFCVRARELGFKVYVDLRVIPGHIGKVTFPLCEKWTKAREAQTQVCERLLSKQNKGEE